MDAAFRCAAANPFMAVTALPMLVVAVLALAFRSPALSITLATISSRTDSNSAFSFASRILRSFLPMYSSCLTASTRSRNSAIVMFLYGIRVSRIPMASAMSGTRPRSSSDAKNSASVPTRRASSAVIGAMLNRSNRLAIWSATSAPMRWRLLSRSTRRR
ncbi:MAG: hypothetical protein ACK55Z_31170 [bacterium]